MEKKELQLNFELSWNQNELPRPEILQNISPDSVLSFSNLYAESKKLLETDWMQEKLAFRYDKKVLSNLKPFRLL